MDDSVLRAYLKDEEHTVERVLRRYVGEHGCPCAWPQFEYWVSKPQGPGWQDSIQNELVRAALDLWFFQARRPGNPRYGLEAIVTCSKCSRTWQHFSEEWRMLAFQHRLLPVHPSPDPASDVILVGANVFSTAGQEPTAARSLTLSEWTIFMLGPSSASPARRGSFLGRIATWFRRPN